MKKYIFIIISVFSVLFVCPQNMPLYKQVISDLSSEEFKGRGIEEYGDIKASEYISSHFGNLDLLYFEDDYYQNFSIPVNTFPGNMKFSVDDKELTTAKDYVVTEYSRGVKGNFDLYYFHQKDLSIEEFVEIAKTGQLDNSFIVMNYNYWQWHRTELSDIHRTEIPGLILLMSSPIRWYVARSFYVLNQTIIWVDKDVFPDDAKTVDVDIQNKFIENYHTRNVIAYIEGHEYADSFFVFTAHYDHLGMLGKDVFYPGANDNASGVAMLITMADYFSDPENKPAYSIAFMAFAAEESGLLGSKHYVKNPLFPLENIKYLINMDMIADNPNEVYFEISDTGLRGYDFLKDYNKNHNYFSSFEKAPLRAMSDHYFFAMASVPTAFVALHGDAFDTLHTIDDIIENIYFDKIPALFNLITGFVMEFR